MLDVHVLLMDYTPSEQHDQCRESIRVAIENADFPVEVHYLPGIYGHLGRARERGYRLGTHPYVTHVDDDDYVHSNAFRALKSYLEDGVDAVTTGEALVVKDKIVQERTLSRHHLAVYKRERLNRVPFQHFRFYPDQFLMRQIKGPHIAEILYYLRLHEDSGSRRCRRENLEEAKREVELLDRPDLVVLENLSNAQIAELYDRLLDEDT